MPITRPFLRVPTRLAKSLIPAHIYEWMERQAQQRRVGVAAIAREIIEREYTRDTQPPASTPDAVSGLAPVSQTSGGDDTSTPADSIRDEADPGGPSAEEVPAPEGIAGDVWNG